MCPSFMACVDVRRFVVVWITRFWGRIFIEGGDWVSLRESKLRLMRLGNGSGLLMGEIGGVVFSDCRGGGMVDAAVSNTVEVKLMRVRVPPPAPIF